MLSKFEVRNFKNFNDWFVFDLSDTKSYEFNPECVENEIVAKSIIYGPNGCGKTNLGRAIFDIKTHLTDERIDDTYSNNYLNAASGLDLAEFKYTFQFGEHIVEYAYGKKAVGKLVYETLRIDGKEVISLDRRKGSVAMVDLAGAETLDKDLDDSDISVVKFVRKNAVLKKDSYTEPFVQFFLFVDMMLLEPSIYSHNVVISNSAEVSRVLLDPGFTGLQPFEDFLNEAGIKCKLTTDEVDGSQRVVFDFGDRKIDFCSTASTGTLSLTMLYFYLMKLKSNIPAIKATDINLFAPFIFIDEFDAFYHHAVSRLIVKQLRGIHCQVVLTTHNTSIMTNDLLRPDCYFLMSETDINPLYRITDKDLRKAHNLEKIYKAGSLHG